MHAAYSAASFMLARMVERSASMGSSLPRVSKCQNVQPLQAGSPCASAPTLWMEPTTGPSDSAPSGRTTALCRRFSSVSTVPGCNRPASTTLAKATRGSLRLAGAGAIESAGRGTTASMRARAAAA